MTRYEDNELVRLYEEYWSAWPPARRGSLPNLAPAARAFRLRYRQGTAAMIADRIARCHS